MDCRDFEAFINELLDRRLPLDLNDAASEHQAACDDCRSDYAFFHDLDGVVGSRIDAAANGLWKNSEDRLVADLVQRCLNEDLLGFNSDAVPVAMVSKSEVIAPPLAKRAPRTGDRSNSARRVTLFSALALGACLVLSIGTFSYWGWNAKPDGPADFAEKSQGQVNGSNAAKVAEREKTQLAVSELQELTKNWDESVVAFDRGWQNAAVGRVRAHQLPGIQPAIYPITGAVEAFRKNMIVRNPNGLAAGVRW
ncbi:MAG: hypothetical protein Q8M16_08190 [Pirellulaceae bacterium]|nr:hypothetical protein [Pirellulaceae bacterium]